MIKTLLKRFKSTIITYHVCNNFLVKLRLIFRMRKTASGATHKGLSVRESLNYINGVYEDYLNYAGLSSQEVAGKTILEIGPGDNFGVALKFLADGAKRVVCLDRFYSERDEAQQAKIYNSLREDLDAKGRRNFDECVVLVDGAEFDDRRLHYVYDTGIDSEDTDFSHQTFDVILSRAVLEHVQDPDKAFEVMGRLLAPGGILIHKVDFRDHGMFSSSGFHPLTFLTISKFTYGLMTSYSGKPNRKLRAYYNQKMEELGYNYKIFITSVLGHSEELIPHMVQEKFARNPKYGDDGLIDMIRSNLAGEFQDVPDQDLMVTGIFLVAHKTA